jgi:glycerol-3-phosphate acyltransferase PlsY
MGAIPNGYIISKMVADIDIRTKGSKNIGATNVGRILGWKYGFIVLLLDALKGAVPVLCAKYFAINFVEMDNLYFTLICGGLAILGHVYTPFLGFKGGKGVATALGVCLTLVPWTTLGASIVFISVYKISKFVSLGSISASISMPIIYFTLGHIFHYEHFSFSIFIILVCISVLILILHLENIKRLLKGEELKATNRGN